MAAATLTYRLPGNPDYAPSAVGPTKAQVCRVNEVVADALFADGATVVNIVHNLQLNATGADGTPEISVTCLAAGTALNFPVIAVVDANTVSIAQVLGSANTGATYRVWIKRPSSLAK